MTTPRYRIGNDLTVFWAIQNRDGSPFDMAGMDIRLFVTNERGRKEVTPILTKLPDGTINNVIRWDFKGDDQRVLGVHTLTVEIMESATHREITKDYCEAFALVSRSEMETDEGDANITIGGDLILSSRLDIYRFEMTNADVAGIKESLNEVQESLADINETIGDISEESLNIKVTINGIQSSVNDLGTEIKTKADATSVIELGEQITEVQTNVYEQTQRVDGLAVELSTKASAESVTTIGESLEITNQTIAEQKTRVDDLEAEISTKASADMVTEIADALKITNDAVAEQTIKVNALESEISTKASADMVTEVADNLKVTNEALAEQTIKVNALESEISTKASADSVAELEAGLQATSKSLAEQTIKVSALESEIDTKASTESVTSLGESINVVSATVAEQKIRTDNIEASIENLVTKEVFNATTGEIEMEFVSVKQTTDAIETTIKSQSGEIISIKENVGGLSVGLGKLESDLDSLRNQMDGVTESYFDDYTPSNTNEPAASWIAEGKEAEHKGDTFTNTAVEGEGAGKSWRWLQDSNGEWSWHPIADTDAQKALALAAQAQAAADGKVTIFYVQPSNYKEGDIWFVHNNEYDPYGKGEILTAIKAGSVFSISDWESKTRYTQAVKDLDDVMNTTFKDGVLDEAERIMIVESLAGITSEKSAVDARYNITIVNSDFTDTTLKNEYKATKSAYDAAYNNLVSIVEQIADATTGLKDLFDEYVSVSEAYAEAYAEHTGKEAEVTEALMGRLNSASVYLDNITNDGILTPIEKEQLFEIYRNIAKEYEATRSNAYNYRIWKYKVDGVTEEAGINGGEGRYESYVEYKNAYDSIATAFGSNIWGFTKMNETTELPDGYSTKLLKEYLDAYYEAHGTLTESFSAITAAIEAAQKAAEATLKELTDNLLPEEMSTLIGKGVVLSTIIATKDAEGKITAGMNASSVHADDEHGRVVFVGGARDINNFNDASFVVYEDGHVKMQSAEIAEYASRGELKDGLDTKADIKDLDDVVAVLQQLSKMWSIDESGNLVTDMQVVIQNNAIIHGDTASGGEGGATSAIGVSGILVNGEVRRDDDGDGIIVLDDYPTSIDWDNINGKPTIPTVPTKVSAFANDAGYITEEDIPTIYPLTIKKADGTSLVIYDPEDEEEVITLDKAVVGLGNVENKSSATIRSEITSENVTSALGYTPANNDDLAKYVLLNAANQTIKGDIRIEGNLVVTGDTASGGTSGGGGTSIGVSGIFVNGETRRDDDGDGIIVLPDYPTSLEWSAINGKPTFATVATSGEYSDLNGLPTIPSLDGYATEEWVEGKNYLTSHQEVVNTGYTLSFGSAIIIGTIGGTQLTAALPSVASVKSTLGLDNYLPLSGGTVTGTIEFTASTPALKFYRDYGNVPYIHFGASPTSGYGEVGADKNGNLVFWSLVSGNSAYNAWNTVLHAKNIGDYALKKVANVTSLNTNAGEFFYSGFRPAHIPYGNYVGGITLQTFRDAENDYRTQLAFSTDAKGFVRNYTNGSWSGWKTIAFTDSNVASAQALKHSNGTIGAVVNSSGNVTIGSSDTAGTDYKLRVDGTSRFTDRVSVTSLRIIPVNGSYAADFAIEGSSLTLNRELKFTNVTASDICSGIAAAFKTSLAQAENLIARNIILGASSGSASNLALNFQKYTSISNTAPSGLTTLMTLTTDGNLGIGTTNPAYKLDVAGSIGCTGGFAAPYFHKSDEFYIGSGALGVSASGALIYTYNNLPIYFFTSGTAAMTIDSGHRVTMEAGLHVKGNFHAGSTWSEDGTSGTAGVTLRNEGGIELTHASTPYIDFHYAAGTTDFSHRLIARTSTVFAYSGNYFCPWGSESLGASSYRWKSVYAKAGNFSGDMEINGALTVGAGATFNGDVRINGNLVVTGDTASGGAGQETTSTLLVINQLIPEGTSVSQSALDAIGLTSNVIDDLLEGKYHHVLEVIGSNKSLYTISGFKSTTTREFILQYGSAEADTAWWYSFRQYNGGNWSVTFDEI